MSNMALPRRQKSTPLRAFTKSRRWRTGADSNSQISMIGFDHREIESARQAWPSAQAMGWRRKAHRAANLPGERA